MSDDDDMMSVSHEERGILNTCKDSGEKELPVFNVKEDWIARSAV